MTILYYLYHTFWCACMQRSKALDYSIKCIWLWILCLLAVCVALGSQPPLSLSEETVVFTRGEGGYYCIKIPSLLTTANGTLIAFGEGRMFSCSDFTWTDLIYKRSVDGGKTWGSLTLLYSNSSMKSGQHTVIGNAAPVVLRGSHRILVPFCRNNLQVLLTFSDDDGVTWSAPTNITGVVPPSWTWQVHVTVIPHHVHDDFYRWISYI